MEKVRVLNQEFTAFKYGEVTELYTLEEVLNTKGLKKFDNHMDLEKYYKNASEDHCFVGFVEHEKHKNADGYRYYVEMYEDDVEFIEDVDKDEEVKEKNINSTIYFAKVNSTKDTIIPSKRIEDGAFDIYANFEEDYIIIKPHETKMIPTNLASAFSSDYVAILKERGSSGSKGIGQRCGVIDSGYRGEWFIPITNHNNVDLVITKLSDKELSYKMVLCGQIRYPYSKAICQALIVEVPKMKTEEISYEELLKFESERGEGKLGSSNK